MSVKRVPHPGNSLHAEKKRITNDVLVPTELPLPYVCRKPCWALEPTVV